jgi:predicted MFS family arabinose efflux permease
LPNEYQFSYFKILKNFRAVLSLISAVSILILTLFFDAIISPHFEYIGISKDVIGYLFGALALSYSLFSPLIAFAAKRIPVRYITFISFGVATVGTFIMGPSNLLGKD